MLGRLLTHQLVIAPGFQRGVAPFTVFCDMSEHNGVGVTVVSHDSENRTQVIGFDGQGEYVREVHYSGAGLSSIAQLVSPPTTSNSSSMNVTILVCLTVVTHLAGGCHVIR